jgi:hypothetical protein
MLVALTVKEWNPRLSFYYPVDNIDNQAVKTHVVWKFAGDANWLIHLSAEADIWQPKSELLNLRNWRFSNEVV